MLSWSCYVITAYRRLAPQRPQRIPLQPQFSSFLSVSKCQCYSNSLVQSLAQNFYFLISELYYILVTIYNFHSESKPRL